MSSMSASRKNMSLLSTKWAKLTPKISTFLAYGTWTIIGNQSEFFVDFLSEKMNEFA